MPRSGTGVYTLPVAPFTPNTIIKSADVNSDFSDVATALTQSLATTGVSTMTGPIKAFSGSQTSPGYSFASALHTGWFLSNTDEISWVANGVVGAVFGASTTVTWNGKIFYSSDVAVTGSVTVGSNLSVTGSLSVTGNAAIGATAAVINLGAGAAIISTTSVDFSGYVLLDQQAAGPAAIAASKLAVYAKADGFSNTPMPFFERADGAIAPLAFVGGQCRLTKSGTSLLLSPYQGNRLTVNGVPCVIPDAGVTLAASNTTNVFVYIYAVANGGAVSGLELSTTVPVAQPGTGIKQKTGDPTRTLIGAAYTDTGGAWADTDGKLWVISYFNRITKSSRTTISASTSVASATYVEINTGIRNNFICWASTTVRIDANIMAFINTTIGDVGWTQVQDENATAFDSAIINASGAGIGGLSNSNINTAIEGVITENTPHYATLFGRITAGVTGTWILGTAKETNSLWVYVEG